MKVMVTHIREWPTYTVTFTLTYQTLTLIFLCTTNTRVSLDPQVCVCKVWNRDRLMITINRFISNRIPSHTYRDLPTIDFTAGNSYGSCRRFFWCVQRLIVHLFKSLFQCVAESLITTVRYIVIKVEGGGVGGSGSDDRSMTLSLIEIGGEKDGDQWSLYEFNFSWLCLSFPWMCYIFEICFEESKAHNIWMTAVTAVTLCVKCLFRYSVIKKYLCRCHTHGWLCGYHCANK